MAYNLQSLITILQHILNPRQTHLFVAGNKPLLESLLQKSIYLKQTLENSSCPKLESLGSQIRDAAHTAEDIIECHMLDQVDWLSFPAPDLQQVMEEFDSAIKQAEEIVEGKTKMLTGSSSSGAAAFLPDRPSSKSAVVGVDKTLLLLKDRLTGQESKLEIVPIVGMGGIGKTTLARELYEDNLIAFKFDVRAWTTISQDYSVREVLLGLLRRPNEKLDDELTECALDKLKQILYQRLFGKRYLVVLDDMWSTDSWDAIRSCFPDNNNGSRIILTTRDSNLARRVGKHNLQHDVQLMNESQSWNLLNKIVFGEEKCSGPIQEIGRKIAIDCGGLPLAINVIGGILSKAERSIDVWHQIANGVRAAIFETGKGTDFFNVLDLSYNHLPNQLKPSFLYLGAFPEDYEIKGSRLIRLLVAEGFAESHRVRSLEEVAGDYLDALVERNLVMVTRKRSNGKALCYGMHDLLRDLCRRKCGEEKFVHVKNERVEVGIMSVKKARARRMSVHASDYSKGMEDVHDTMPLARSFLILCLGGDMSPEIVSPVLSVLRLLRVLDVFDVQFKEFPVEVLELVNLRFLALSSNCDVDMPRGILRLLNLQTLLAQLHDGDVPDEIWEMPELRHLNLFSCMHIEEGHTKENMQEKKLQTLRSVVCDPSAIRMGFFNTIPNVIDLGIYMDDSLFEGIVVDLSHLLKLKTLRCFSNGWRYLARLRFPPSLRKLTLFECLIFPRDWETLCALPNLEVLKISECVLEKEVIELEGSTEEDDEYVFRSLQFLHLDRLQNLVRWTADDANFPRLRELVLIECPELEGIPSGIGDISTLQRIQVTGCGPSVEESAKQIQEVQRSENDNYDLKLYISH